MVGSSICSKRVNKLVRLFAKRLDLFLDQEVWIVFDRLMVKECVAIQSICLFVRELLSTFSPVAQLSCGRI